VVTGEVEVEADGIWNLIDDVAGRDGDVEAVAPAAGGVEVDGIDAGLVVEGQCMGAYDACTDKQERSGLMGILAGGHLEVELDGLVEGVGLGE
jgi:hypothetical protein